MSPTLERVAGDRFIEASQTTTAEDFSYFANEVPGLFLFLGVAPDDPTLIIPTTRLASMRTNERSRWCRGTDLHDLGLHDVRAVTARTKVELKGASKLTF